MIDLAVGVIIGGAFGKIVTSFVEEIVMPPVGLITGKVDFSNLYISLSDKITPGTSLTEAKKLGPVIAYGNFLTVVVQFIILSFVIFMMIKAINKLRAKSETPEAPAAPAEPAADIALLTEIRDLLKSK